MNVIAAEPRFGSQNERGLAELFGDSSMVPLWWRAERLGAPSAWWQHVPFAHWLVAATAPRCLVELGTHAGVSYAAFCQSAMRSGSGTRCYAVDTWTGDEQAGAYGEEIYDDLRRYNEENHSGFSTLLRMTFDQASEAIADNSVDLLHIDGLHTYDAVSHDYQRWRPKLTERGVVLFHDITEHKREFGVWRLWSELRARHPSFEFPHGHGLGVLAVGDDVPVAVARLCEARDQAAVATFRSLFLRLGERWEHETRERMASAALDTQIEAAGKQARDAKAHFDALESELQRATASAIANEAALSRLNQQARDEAAQAEDELRRIEAERNALSSQVQAEQRMCAETTGRAAQIQAALEQTDLALLDARENAERAWLAVEDARQQDRQALSEARESAARAWAMLEDDSEQTRLKLAVAADNELRAARAEADLAMARAERDMLLSSTTWRATLPIRAVAARVPFRWRRAARGIARRTLRGAPPAVERSEAGGVGVQDGAPQTALASPAPAHAAKTMGRDANGTPKVVWISGEPNFAGHTYRVSRPAASAAALGIGASIIGLTDVPYRIREIETADILVVWRAAWDNNVALAIDTADRLGVRIIFDVDDLMFDPRLARTELIDGIRTQGLTEQEVRAYYARVQATMGRAALCLATTDELAGHMRAMGKPAIVLPNGYDEETWNRSRLAARRRAAAEQDGLVRLGYAGGSRTHQRDFAACAEAVAAVLRNHPQCRLVLFKAPQSGRPLLDVAEYPCLGDAQEQIEWRDAVPLADLPDELARFDINLVPLETGNVFVEAKSDLKFFEAALAGVVTIASPTGPFGRAIVSGKTGVLATSGAEWERHLTALVVDSDARRALAAAALLSVLWQYGPERRALELASIIDLQAPARVAARAFAVRAQSHGRTALDLVVPDHEIVFTSDRLRVADVAVLVPLYNYAHTVVEALESARSQNVAKLDLVVVDDRSTDDSLAVVLAWVRQHASRFNRVVVARNTRNEGLGAARNVGFALAETPWVMALDADNRLRPACVGACLDAARTAGAAFAYPVLQMFGDRTDRLGERDWDPVFLANMNFVDAMALISRAAWASVGGYDRTRTGWEDYDLWCGFAAAGLWGVRVPGEPLAEYRVHGASMIQAAVRQREKILWMMDHSRSRHPWLTLVEPEMPNAANFSDLAVVPIEER